MHGSCQWYVLIDRLQALLTEIKSIGHLVNRVNDLEAFKAVNEQTTTMLKNEIINLKDRSDDILNDVGEICVFLCMVWKRPTTKIQMMP